jgi:hypothetical protein
MKFPHDRQTQNQDHRPRIVMVQAVSLLVILLGVTVFLISAIVTTNGTRTYILLRVTSGIARASLGYVLDLMDTIRP